jgi:hypothetical protein
LDFKTAEEKKAAAARKAVAEKAKEQEAAARAKALAMNEEANKVKESKVSEVASETVEVRRRKGDCLSVILLYTYTLCTKQNEVVGVGCVSFCVADFSFMVTHTPSLSISKLGADGAFDMDAAPSITPDTPPPAAAAETITAAEEKEEEEDKGPAPLGNGMVLEKYSWTQQLADLEIVVPVPEGTRTKDLKVKDEPTFFLIVKLTSFLHFINAHQCVNGV